MGEDEGIGVRLGGGDAVPVLAVGSDGIGVLEGYVGFVEEGAAVPVGSGT